jgi:hypothetical protein
MSLADADAAVDVAPDAVPVVDPPAAWDVAPNTAPSETRAAAKAVG